MKALFVLAGMLCALGPASAAVTLFTISMTGLQETPANSSGAGSGGIASFDSGANTISVSVFFAGLAAPATASHIHIGGPGTNGSVIVSFVAYTPAATTGSIAGGPLAFPPANVPDLLAGNTYFNMHNASFPGGELRGQLVPVSARPVPGDVNNDGIVSQNELNAVLTNYWIHSAWVTMTNPAGLGSTNIQFALTNATAWDFSVLVSTNLQDWVYRGVAHPLYQFADPLATNQPQRYYRLQWP